MIIEIIVIFGADSLVVSVLTYSATALTTTGARFQSRGPLAILLSCHLSIVLSSKMQFKKDHKNNNNKIRNNYN